MEEEKKIEAKKKIAFKSRLSHAKTPKQKSSRNDEKFGLLPRKGRRCCIKIMSRLTVV